jgi:multiple sugar transport system permease protein
MMSENWLSRAGKGIAYLFLTAWAVISLFPLYWMFITSIQLERWTETVPPKLLPVGLLNYLHSGQATWLTQTFDTYHKLLLNPNLYRWFWNSFYIALVVMCGHLLLDSMAAYVLAKKQFPGRTAIFWIIIATLMVPSEVTLVPLFIMVRKLGLYDTHWALIVPGLAGAFGVFMLRQFMLGLPSELIEAATIDGANEWQIYSRIILPLAMPAMATLGIFSFMGTWNNFLWPLIVISKAPLMTLPIGLKTLQDANLAIFKLLMAGASIAALPMIIIFLVFQRYIVKGLTVGSLKG